MPPVTFFFVALVRDDMVYYVAGPSVNLDTMQAEQQRLQLENKNGKHVYQVVSVDIPMRQAMLW